MIVPPTSPVPLPRIVTGCSLAFESRLEQLFLGDAAVAAQSAAAAALSMLACPSRRARCATTPASARSMLSPPSRMCSPTATRFERQLAIALGDGDQSEIGGAAADIDDQDQVADLDALAPVGVPLDPGVEGGLRLLEQGDVLVAGLSAGFARQLARDGVERCGHGDQHLLLRERRVGHVLLSQAFAEMFQVAAAGLDGRDLVHAFGRAGAAGSAEVRSTPECDSHDLADDTRRPAFSTPRFCARRPTT